MLTNTEKANLNHHLSILCDNREWLGKAKDIEEDKGWEAFPYRKVDKEGKVLPERLLPKTPSTLMPDIPDSSVAQYVVNLPMVHSPNEEGYKSIDQVFKMFKEESFGKTKEISKEKVKKTLAIVIGVNQMLSLDKEVNRQFSRWVKNLPKTDMIPNRIEGFFWEPRWVKQNGDKYVYKPDEAFFILKNLAPEAAIKVREELEKPITSSEIPYQQIRNQIKTSPSTKKFAKHFEKNSETTPIYLATLDDDLISLKTDKGLFSRYNQLVKRFNTPSVMSLGYSVKEENNPIIELGVKLDMLVRTAMTKEIPYSAYFPEPNTLFCIRRPGKKLSLKKLTFLGNGNNLESRRIIKSGRSQKIFKEDAVFSYDGGVLMKTPKRMYTEKNKAITKLNTNNLKTKGVLKALRFVSQSHIFPKEWADNLYLSLPLTAPQVTDVTGPLMHLFAVYDPINRMFSTPGRFSKKTFVDVLLSYNDPLSLSLQSLKNETIKKLTDLKIDADTIQKIESAARESGKAIFNEFLSLTKI